MTLNNNHGKQFFVVVCSLKEIISFEIIISQTIKPSINYTLQDHISPFSQLQSSDGLIRHHVLNMNERLQYIANNTELEQNNPNSHYMERQNMDVNTKDNSGDALFLHDSITNEIEKCIHSVTICL